MKKVILIGLCLVTYLTHSHAQFTLFTTSNSNLTTDDVTSLTVAANGDIWVATALGLVRYNGSIWTQFNQGNSGLTYDYYSEILAVPGGQWCSHVSGMGFWDGTNYTDYTNSLGDWSIQAMELDADGDLWVGTYDGGLDHYDGSTWTNYNTSNSGLPHNLVQDIGFDNNGNIWCATDGGGLAKFDGVSTWTVYNTGNSGVPDNSLGMVNATPNGDIWVAAEYGTGAAVFDGTTWTSIDSTDYGIPNTYFFDLIVDGAGVIWIATTDGLLKNDGGTWSVYTTGNSNLSNHMMTRLIIDNNADLWMTTQSGGVAKLGALTGIAETEEQAFVSIYPNPSAGDLNISLYLAQSERVKLSVINSVGQLIFSEQSTQPAGSWVERVDLSQYPVGLYMVHVQTSAVSVSKQVVIH